MFDVLEHIEEDVQINNLIRKKESDSSIYLHNVNKYLTYIFAFERYFFTKFTFSFWGFYFYFIMK